MIEVFDEYKVTFRREGLKTQYRLFQKKANAVKFLADVQKTTRTELPPLVMITLEARPCGDWYPLTIISEGAAHES